MAYQGVEDYPSKQQQQPQPYAQPYAQQPQYNAMAPVPQQTWAFDTFSCLQDTDECLDVWCCHYCKFGYIGHRLERGFPGFDAGYCCGACCADACFYGAGTVVVTYMQRERIVRRYGIIEDGCTTFMLSLCCAACAICQQAREMKHRGECVGGVCVPAAPQPLSTMGGGPVAGQPVYPQQQQPQPQQQPRPQQQPQAAAQQGYPAAYGQNAQGYPAAGYQQQPQPQGGVYAQPAQYYS